MCVCGGGEEGGCVWYDRSSVWNLNGRYVRSDKSAPTYRPVTASGVHELDINYGRAGGPEGGEESREERGGGRRGGFSRQAGLDA